MIASSILTLQYLRYENLWNWHYYPSSGEPNVLMFLMYTTQRRISDELFIWGTLKKKTGIQMTFIVIPVCTAMRAERN